LGRTGGHPTAGLVLLTATPMQVHLVEVFDLLGLLGLPPEWGQEAFLRFFEEIGQESPSHEAFERLAAMFRAVAASYGPVAVEEVRRLGEVGGLRAKKLLGALRDRAAIPRRQLETADRRLALRLMRLHTPIGRLVSRHTRELLRRYHKAGKLSTPIADRHVRDRFIDLSPGERQVYEAVEEYISTTWNQAASTAERNAIGFVMTIYRRRLASSFLALARTLEGHLHRIGSPAVAGQRDDLDEDVPDDEVGGEEPDLDEAERLERAALDIEERSDVERLLAMVRRLPPDTKLGRLRDEIAALRSDGFAQAMVFTQFTDTIDFLRRELVRDPDARVMCFSGRGGEVPARDGTWRVISRDEAKRRFREGEADLLLCTDAAEGLNFQFWGALINYDMPWNPMRVEQRIGRIDRLGQRYPVIRILNLHYADTVEADAYRALRERIGLFQKVVGRLQPILARLPTLIADRVHDGRAGDAGERRAAAAGVAAEAEEAARGAGFDIDAATDADLATPPRPAPALAMADLERVIATPPLLPPGIEVAPLGPREYALRMPGFSAMLRVSTDPAYYEQHADTVELWSPGSPAFPPGTAGTDAGYTRAASLRELLDAFPASNPSVQAHAKGL
jgi:hypothetical protein